MGLEPSRCRELAQCFDSSPRHSGSPETRVRVVQDARLSAECLSRNDESLGQGSAAAAEARVLSEYREVGRHGETLASRVESE